MNPSPSTPDGSGPCEGAAAEGETMTDKTAATLRERIAAVGVKKKAVAGAVAVLALAGHGMGAANAATPPAPAQHSVQQSADASGPGEAAGDSGANVQQAGDHTDPGDLPGSQ